MIHIDTVYQKVLVLANKEQRGYITPQEFNLLADQAQNEIYNSYFYDIKSSLHHPIKNQESAFDDVEMLREKLHPFMETVSYPLTEGAISFGNIGDSVSTGEHRIESIYIDGGDEVMEVNRKELNAILSNPLTAPTPKRMIYVRNQSPVSNTVPHIRIYPTITEDVTLIVNYYRAPTEERKPNWAYVIVKGKPLYFNTNSVNFRLHKSEEENLVMRILQLAGVIIMKPGIVEVAMTDAARTKQEQSN